MGCGIARVGRKRQSPSAENRRLGSFQTDSDLWAAEKGADKEAAKRQL